MMTIKPRSWWQQIKKHRLVIGIIAVLVVVVALIFVEVRVNGTGFKGKTLWDWLNLLGVLAIPVVVGFGAVWFTYRQGKVAEAENTDNQHETALQSYIDKISELLLEKNLRNSAKGDEVRIIARVRTLTILSHLDSKRKGSVLQFLYESQLITRDKDTINLQGADLSNADLSRANLSEAVLAGANLTGANLSQTYLSNTILSLANLSSAYLDGAYLGGTILNEANLSRANLSRANLSRANLFGADLSQATITEQQLDQAQSLMNATMPDGSKHP